jgi:hypothetical protein
LAVGKVWQLYYVYYATFDCDIRRANSRQNCEAVAARRSSYKAVRDCRAFSVFSMVLSIACRIVNLGQNLEDTNGRSRT